MTINGDNVVGGDKGDINGGDSDECGISGGEK